MKETGTIWKPNVTVAAVTEKNGRYLIVEEEVTEGIRFNQPAGHLEDGESLISAVIRECLEETTWSFHPEYLIGIYRTHLRDVTYLRFAFAGTCDTQNLDRELDHGIIAAHWLTVDEIKQKSSQLRSPTVIKSIEDHMAGQHHPLSILTDLHEQTHWIALKCPVIK